LANHQPYRTAFESDNRRSMLPAGTALHAPHLPFAIPVGTVSVGWIADLRESQGERHGCAAFALARVLPRKYQLRLALKRIQKGGEIRFLLRRQPDPETLVIKLHDGLQCRG
jgi:hypothetical protein